MTTQPPDLVAPLSGRTTRGAAWLVGARLTSKAIDFAMLLILARLLSPAQFGVIAIAIPLVQIVEAVLELPVGQVLVSAGHVGRRETDTAFTLGLIRALMVAVLLGLASFPVAALYGDDKLRVILPLLALAPALRGLASPRLALFARTLNFRREFLAELVGKFAALLLSTVAAMALGDYRALIVGTIAAPAFAGITSYVVAPYMPRLSLAAWPTFAHFVGWSTAAQFLTAMTWQCDRLALGSFVSPARLGEFSLANDLAYVPEQALIKPIVRPLMSAFVAVRDDPVRLRNGFDKAVATILMIGLPMMVGLSVLADPAVRLVLGGKWLRAIPMLQLLPLTLIPALAVAPLPSLAMALGRPEIVWRQQRIEASCRIPLVVLGAWYLGIPGVIAARMIGGIVAAISSLRFASDLIDHPIRRQIVSLSRILLAGGALAIMLVTLAPMLGAATGVRLLAGLVVVAACGMTVYMVMLLLLWRLGGRPQGIESVAMGQMATLWRRGITQPRR